MWAAEIFGECLVRVATTEGWRKLAAYRISWGRRPGRKGATVLRSRRSSGNSPDMNEETDGAVLRIRIVFGAHEMIGPGKAELLERIAATGSIAAAAREMRMSYKRAWMLIETLNAIFREPVVESTRGGPGGGGAALTETGRRVLAIYRAFEADAAEAGASRLGELRSMLVDIPSRQ